MSLCTQVLHRHHFIKLPKNLSGTLSECQTFWIQISTDILSVLIWVQTVCKEYQQTTKGTTTASKEIVKLFRHGQLLQNLFILLHALSYGPRREKTCLRGFVKASFKPVSSATETS